MFEPADYELTDEEIDAFEAFDAERAEEDIAQWEAEQRAFIGPPAPPNPDIPW